MVYVYYIGCKLDMRCWKVLLHLRDIVIEDAGDGDGCCADGTWRILNLPPSAFQACVGWSRSVYDRSWDRYTADWCTFLAHQVTSLLSYCRAGIPRYPLTLSVLLVVDVLPSCLVAGPDSEPIQFGKAFGSLWAIQVSQSVSHLADKQKACEEVHHTSQRA